MTLFFVVLHLTAREMVFKPLHIANKDLVRIQARLDQTKQLLHEYPEARNRTKDILARIDALREKSVSTKGLPKINKEITQKASELKIDIISIKPVEKPNFSETNLPQGVSKAYIEVVMRASYKTIGDYLNAIKQMPFSLTVEEVSLERSSESDATGRGMNAAKPRPGAKENASGGEVVATILIGSCMIWFL